MVFNGLRWSQMVLDGLKWSLRVLDVLSESDLVDLYYQRMV